MATVDRELQKKSDRNPSLVAGAEPLLFLYIRSRGKRNPGLAAQAAGVFIASWRRDHPMPQMPPWNYTPRKPYARGRRIPTGHCRSDCIKPE